MVVLYIIVVVLFITVVATGCTAVATGCTAVVTGCKLFHGCLCVHNIGFVKLYDIWYTGCVRLCCILSQIQSYMQPNSR